MFWFSLDILTTFYCLNQSNLFNYKLTKLFSIIKMFLKIILKKSEIQLATWQKCCDHRDTVTFSYQETNQSSSLKLTVFPVSQKHQWRDTSNKWPTLLIYPWNGIEKVKNYCYNSFKRKLHECSSLVTARKNFLFHFFSSMNWYDKVQQSSGQHWIEHFTRVISVKYLSHSLILRRINNDYVLFFFPEQEANYFWAKFTDTVLY